MSPCLCFPSAGAHDHFWLSTVSVWGAVERAQWVIVVIAIKPDNLRSMSRTHMVEGENSLLQAVH